MNKSVVLIPSLNPPWEFGEYVKQLSDNGFAVIVVNDGSRAEYESLFQQIASIPACVVVHHPHNMGKGRGLKTGLQYFLEHLLPTGQYCGVITADSDGQHSVADIIRLAEEQQKSENSRTLILGARDFDLDIVPPKSKFGNKLTRRVFHWFYGLKIVDTQTGLRAIPSQLMEDFIRLKGEAFEYETNMLIYCARHKIPVREIPIQTIYRDNNSESHFNPVVDSIRIYSLLIGTFIKYTLSSLSCFVLDILLFQLCLWLVPRLNTTLWGFDANILIATVFARMISSLVNYSINRKVVFESNGDVKKSLLYYYLLAIVQMTASAYLVSAIYYLVQAVEALIKILVDTSLFVGSYLLQKYVVFRDAGHNGK